MTSDRTTLGIGIALAVVALVVVIAVAAAPTSSSSRIRAIQADLRALRDAQLDHLDAFGHAVPSGWAPRPVTELTAEPVAWAPSEGFRTLAWAPADREAVYATYATTVGSSGFVVTARCDLDGDGVPAEFRATARAGVTRQTPPEVR